MIQSFCINRVYSFIVLLVATMFISVNVQADSRIGQASSVVMEPSSGGLVTAPSELRDLIERWSADQRSLEHFYVFPFSVARLSRFEEFHKEWLGILEGIDFESLSIDGQVDYLLFRNHLNRSLLQLDKEAASAKETLSHFPFAQTIIDLREDLQRMQCGGHHQATRTGARRYCLASCLPARY